MTPAEWQARYRAAQASAAPAVKVRYRKPVDRRSRPQADYQQWLDTLPESLAEGATADALRAICEVDLSNLEVEPPRGFGRD